MLLPPLIIPTAIRLPVRFTGVPVPHATSGYRNWSGQFEASQPIVALVLAITGSHLSWTRTSHRGNAMLKTHILFAPYDEEGRNIQVCFGVLDATVYGRTCVDSIFVQPAPQVKVFMTGELVDIAHTPGLRHAN